jgi:hypothetical protein
VVYGSTAVLQSDGQGMFQNAITDYGDFFLELLQTVMFTLSLFIRHTLNWPTELFGSD